MKEIAFRFWDKKLKSFVNHDKLAGYFGITFDGKIMYTAPFMDKDFSEQLELEQYTGRKDKNGKEGYDGDIVKDERDKEIGVIKHGEWISDDVYDCGETYIFGFYLDLKSFRDDGSHYNLQHSITELSGYEIAGNIHMNPDLLK